MSLEASRRLSDFAFRKKIHRTVTVRPIRIIRKRNVIEEQRKIIPQRRRRFLDDEVAHRELEGVLFPDILASLGAAPIELCSLPSSMSAFFELVLPVVISPSRLWQLALASLTACES